MSSKIVVCGINTSTLPKFTSKEMLEMLKEVKMGNKEMKKQFIFANLRLVLSITHRFNSKSSTADDLFQVGCVGLIKAIDNFDMELNLKFSTYAVPMIIGEIRRFLRDNASIRVARSMRDLAYRALQVKEMLTKENSVEPKIEEIALRLNMPYKDVVCALDAISEPISLFEPIYTDDSDALEIMDQVSDQKESMDNWSMNVAVKQAVKNLPYKEREILIMRYYLGKTQIEISNEVGISQAQVSRLEKNALREIELSI